MKKTVFASLVATLVAASGSYAQVHDLITPDGVTVTSANPTAPVVRGGGGSLYDNGPLINSPGTGAGGADESLVQNNSLGLTTLGIRNSLALTDRASDEFVIPDALGWQIDSCTLYGYQTGSTTTSTITAVNLQIWDGSPDLPGSTVVFGDNATNRMASTDWSGIYRAAESTAGDTTRPIMAQEITIDTVLGPGTYWLDWQTDGTLGSGPWAPPITINGQTVTGNGLVSVDDGATWASFVDGGLATAQGFPFFCDGSVISAATLEVPALGGFGLAAFGALLAGLALIFVKRR